jgi:hypothetical protein
VKLLLDTDVCIAIMNRDRRVPGLAVAGWLA